MKNKIILLTMVLMMVLSLSAFAAPGSLPVGVTGTTSGILTVTNPAAANISSFDKVHNISGYAADGVELSVYILSGGVYNLLYRNGYPVVCTVGASGMFVQPIPLSHGRNDILIRAELNGQVQYATRTITILSSNFLNLLKGFNLF